jgi:hypothetical protein
MAEAEYPRSIAKDRYGAFSIDRHDGTLVLIADKPGGQQVRLAVSENVKSAIIDFVASTARELTAWKSLPDISMQADRLCYRFEWPDGDMTIERLSAQRICNVLRFE